MLHVVEDLYWNLMLAILVAKTSSANSGSWHKVVVVKQPGDLNVMGCGSLFQM